MKNCTRRAFIAACTATAVSLRVSEVLSGAPKKRPNLLFVMTDQQSFDMIGLVNPQVQTPVLNGLAKGGVHFKHAVSNQPICTPFRGMLFSGQHPLYNACFSNDLPLLPNTSDRFAHVLKRAGYETAYIGKWHLYGGGTRKTGIPPGPNRHGFDETFLTNNCHVDYRPNSCYYWNDNNEQVFFKDVYPDKPWELEAQTRQAEGWFARSDRDRPFALFVSWHPPHDFGGQDICPDLPGHQYNYDVDVLDPALLEPYDGRNIRLREGSPDQDKVKACRRRQYRNYMAMVTACDAALGRLIRKLKEQDVHEDTLIVFTSDHGDMLGSHGAQKPKQYPQDYSLRIPLVMHWSGHIPAGRTSGLLVGAMDMMPTILGLMGLPIPASIQGSNLSRAIRTSDDAVVESVPIFMYPGRGAWRGVYTRDWTYARGIAGNAKRLGVEINVLYNRKKDPSQLNNLFGNPAYADKQAQLEAQTREWMKRFGDREYTAKDFLKAQKIARILAWNKNYSHRPIDLLRNLEQSS